MGFTSKYEFEDMAYSTADKSGIVTSNIGKMDDNLHTYLEGAAGESISQYDAVYLAADGKWYQARANGSKHPSHGLAIEAAVLDVSFRTQRIGPITNAGWSWTVGKPVYLSPTTLGGLTQTRPAIWPQYMGMAISATSILLNVSIDSGILPTTTTSTTTTSSTTTTTTSTSTTTTTSSSSTTTTTTA